MASYTLDDIRAATERLYGSVELDLGEQGKVTLRNPLRLERAERKRLIELQEQGEGEDGEDTRSEEEQVESLHGIVRLIAASPAQADALLAYAGDDLAVLATVFKLYSDATQAGEA